jgi:hypothetical protein
MMTETVDPIALFAQLNPVSPERLDELDRKDERETTYARITARRGAPRRGAQLPKRRLTIVLVASCALAIPALAFSGALDSLFGFSTHGTLVRQDDLSSVTGLDLSGAKSGSLVQLAAREGVGIYAAKTATGDLCYFIGPPSQRDLKRRGPGLGGGCLNAAASAKFPSPAEPVVDMSTFEAPPPDAIEHASVQRLAGVAADGVNSVQVLALADCHVVATAPVIENVYMTANLPLVPAAVIVALDGGGHAVWHESVTEGANAASCGIG